MLYRAVQKFPRIMPTGVDIWEEIAHTPTLDPEAFGTEAVRGQKAGPYLRTFSRIGKPPI
jgi:hypothetical protein